MVGYDHRKGYFLACGRGNVSHSGHCKDLYWASHPPSSLVDNTIVQRMLGLRRSHVALSKLKVSITSPLEPSNQEQRFVSSPVEVTPRYLLTTKLIMIPRIS